MPIRFLLKHSLLLAFLIGALTAQAELTKVQNKLTFHPSAEYYDCAPNPFPKGDVNLIGGKDLQSVGKKASTTFVHGSQLYIIAEESGEFVGLYAKIYGPDNNRDLSKPSKEDLILDRKNLEKTIYIESNEITPGSFVEGYHLPVFSFSLCKDEPITKNSVCLDLGYLNEIDPWEDVFKASIASKWVQFGNALGYNWGTESNVQVNFDRINSEKSNRWRNQRLYAEWDSEGNTVTYIKEKDNTKQRVDIMLGMLNVDEDGYYWGTNEIHTEAYEPSLKATGNQGAQVKSLLYEKKCVNFKK